jgi:hypothetical protein
VAAAYEGAETVRSSPQAQSVALPISAKSILRVAIHLREVRRHAGRQGWRREMGGWVAVRALTFADRRGANFSVTETGWSLDLCPMRELRRVANRPKILRCRKCSHDVGASRREQPWSAAVYTSRSNEQTRRRPSYATRHDSRGHIPRL